MNGNSEERLGELRLIGEQLHKNQFPRVSNGGVVRPNAPLHKTIKGLESEDEPERQRRSKTRKRKRTTGWQRPAGSTPPVSLREFYKKEARELKNFYPGAEACEQNEGLIIKAPIHPLQSVQRRATLVIALRLVPLADFRSWAFWENGRWIGPRHTNYPDGSVCAFHKSDNTWRFGSSLVNLLDLHSLWILRHLHLEKFGFWPGPQLVEKLAERLLELKPNEICGCKANHELKKYSDCCMAADKAHPRKLPMIALHLQNEITTGRKPPDSVCRFAKNANSFLHLSKAIPLNTKPNNQVFRQIFLQNRLSKQ